MVDVLIRIVDGGKRWCFRAAVPAYSPQRVYVSMMRGCEMAGWWGILNTVEEQDFSIGLCFVFLFCCLGFLVPMTSFAFVRRLYRVGLESDSSECTLNVPDTVFAREDAYTWWWRLHCHSKPQPRVHACRRVTQRSYALRRRRPAPSLSESKETCTAPGRSAFTKLVEPATSTGSRWGSFERSIVWRLDMFKIRRSLDCIGGINCPGFVV